MNAPHEEAAEFAKVSKRENRVYVGNLSYDVKYRDLMEFMRGGGLGNLRSVFLRVELGLVVSGKGDVAEGAGEARLSMRMRTSGSDASEAEAVLRRTHETRYGGLGHGSGVWYREEAVAGRVHRSSPIADVFHGFSRFTDGAAS